TGARIPGRPSPGSCYSGTALGVGGGSWVVSVRAGGRVRRGPVPVGVYRSGQGGEQQAGPDLLGDPERLQADQQVLLDAGERQDGPVPGEFVADLVQGLEGG